MSSLICEASSVSDYEAILPEPLSRNPRTTPYQVSRFVEEPPKETFLPWFYRRSRIDFNPEGNPIWLTRSTLGQPAQTSYHYRSPQFLAHATDAFEPVAVFRTGTHSSVDSDGSHCSTPETHKLVKAPDNNRICAFDEPELEPDSDEDEDAFESLNTAIINVLGPDRAAGLIPHLYQLPAHLRAFLFGFATHNGGEDNTLVLGYESDAGPSIQNPTQGLDGSETSKRKRRPAGENTSPARVAQERKTRVKPYKRVKMLTYACPFNIFDPKKYCIRNEIGGTGSRYSACMGPGFSEPRRLKEHFESAHRMPQCQRCWKIFDASDQLSYHTNQEEPRCENRTDMLVHGKEMITETEWNKIKGALSQPRLKKGEDGPRKTEGGQWFEVWDILFPKSTYPTVPRPSHPYYVNPERAYNPLPNYPETERMIEIWKALWDKKVEDAKASDPEAEYKPSKDEVEKMIREAASIANQSAPNHLPAAKSTESLAYGSTPIVPEPPGGYFQPGYHQTTPNFHEDDSIHGINPSALNPLDMFSQDPYSTNGMRVRGGFDFSTIDANNPHSSTLDLTNPDDDAFFNSLVQDMPSAG